MNKYRNYVIESPFFTVQERAVQKEDTGHVLSEYCNDIYKLLLYKLALYEKSSDPKPQEQAELSDLLEELIRVKNRLTYVTGR